MADDQLPTPERVLVVAAHPGRHRVRRGRHGRALGGRGRRVRLPARHARRQGQRRPGRRRRGAGPRCASASSGRPPRRSACRRSSSCDEPDGQVEPSLALRERITRAIRTLRPGDRDDPRPDRAVRQQRVGQPSRPPRRRAGDGRRRLPDRARPAELPRAPRGRPRGLEGRPSCTCGARTRRTRSSTSAPRIERKVAALVASRQPVPVLRRHRALGAPPERRSSASAPATARPRPSGA